MKVWILQMKDIEEDKISIHSNFIQLGFDSLDFVEIEFNIRKDYGVGLNHELIALKKIVNINDLIKYIIFESNATN
uniref:acyl carrier protein n=2 Tax=Serratia TaxID=613 RepID=UPI001F4C26E6|nr:phosphopantetheine-binding protein [Serratia proteamaculans]